MQRDYKITEQSNFDKPSTCCYLPFVAENFQEHWKNRGGDDIRKEKLNTMMCRLETDDALVTRKSDKNASRDYI